MELNQLYDFIDKIFTREGLIRDTKFINDRPRAAHYILEPTDTYKTTEHWNYHGEERTTTFMNGLDISVGRVYHSNGDGKTDISYRLWINKWTKSSGCGLYKVKISSKQTEKTIEKKLLVFLDEYYKIRNETEI